MESVKHIHVYSGLSQGYLSVEDQLSFGSKCFAVEKEGVYLSALDQNQQLWTAYPKSGTMSGTIVYKTPYLASSTVLLSRSTGEATLFTSIQNELYVQKNMKNSGQASLERIEFPKPPTGAVLRKILVEEYEAEQGILLAVFYELAGSYQVKLAFWNTEEAPYVFGSNLQPAGCDGLWHVDQTNDTMEFIALNSTKNAILRFDIDTQKVRTMPLPSQADQLLGCSVNDTAHLYILDHQDHFLYRLTTDDQGNLQNVPAFSLQEQQQLTPYTKTAVQAVAGNVHLWTLDSQGNLFHLTDTQQTGNDEAENGKILMLEQGICDFCVPNGKGDGNVHLMLSKSAFNQNDSQKNGDFKATGNNALQEQLSIYHLPQEGEIAVTSVWTDAANNSVEVDCYTTEISLTDKNGLPAAQCNLELQMAQDADLSIGEKQYHASAGKLLTVTTNAQGKLVIRQKQENITAVNFTFRIQGESQYYTVRPDGKNIETIKTVTADGLAQTKLDDGTMLLKDGQPEEIRKETAKQVSDLVGQMLAQVEQTNEACVEDSRLDTASKRFVTCLNGNSMEKTGVPEPIHMGRFHVIFDDNAGIQVHRIENDKQMAQVYERFEQKTGVHVTELLCSNSIFSKIKEFFRSVLKSFVHVVEMVVDEAKLVFHYIVKGIKQVVAFVVKTVKDVLHAVQVVLHKIEVGFKKLIQWLGMLFNWKDIKNTKKYLEQTVDKTLAFGRNWASDPQRIQDIKHVFHSMGDSIDQVLDHLKLDVDFNQTKAAADSDHENTDLQDTVNSNHVVMQKLSDPDTQNLLMAADGVFCMTQAQQSIFDDVIAQLSNLELPTKEWNLFLGDLQKFIAHASDVNALVDMLVDLLKLIIHAFLDFTMDIILILAGVVTKLLDTLQSFFEGELYIPVLSSLLKIVGVTGLTIKTVFLYLLAIPVTIAYKLRYGKAPITANETENDLQLADTDSKLYRVAQWGFCSIYYILNDIGCAEDIEGVKTTFGKTINICVILSSIGWVAMDYYKDISDTKKAKKEVSTETYVCLAADCCGIMYDIITTFKNFESPKARVVCPIIEAGMAVTYTCSAIVDCCKNGMNPVQKSAYIAPGLCDLFMAGRFIPDFGPVCWTCGVLCSIFQIVMEGVQDFTPKSQLELQLSYGQERGNSRV